MLVLWSDDDVAGESSESNAFWSSSRCFFTTLQSSGATSFRTSAMGSIPMLFIICAVCGSSAKVASYFSTAYPNAIALSLFTGLFPEIPFLLRMLLTFASAFLASETLSVSCTSIPSFSSSALILP